MSRSKKKENAISILDRFIVTQMANSFIFGVLVFSVLLVAGDLLFQIANLMIDKGVSLGVVARLFIYKLPEVVVMTLPMASLLSALLTFGRLSSQSEIVALRAAGISFRRIVKPVLAASVLVSLGAILLNETIVPLSNRAADNIMRYEIARERPTLLREKVFLRDEGDGELRRVIYISRLRQNLGTMEDIVVQEFEEGAMSRIVTASRGTWRGGEWWLEDGKTFEVLKDRTVKLLFTFVRQKLPLTWPAESPDIPGCRDERLPTLEAYQRHEQRPTSPLRVLFLKRAVPWACVILAVSQRRWAGTTIGAGLATSVLIVFTTCSCPSPAHSARPACPQSSWPGAEPGLPHHRRLP